MKKFNWKFWLPNGFMVLMMMFSGVMYLVQSAEIAKIFAELQYPAYTLYFNATAKILGGLAIILPQVPRFLKEWAYAGYLYIILLALQAVVMTMPGFPWIMIVSLAVWTLAYWQFKKLEK